MPTFLGQLGFHHTSNKNPYNFLLDIPDGADPIAHTIVFAIYNEFGTNAEREIGKIVEALAKARATNEPVSFKVLAEDVKNEPGEDDYNEYTLWAHPPEKPDGTPNIGFGPNDGSSRYENVWIEVKPFEPDQTMRKKLENLTKEQLLEILLRTHASGGLSFPPEVG